MKEKAYFVFRPRTAADLGPKNPEGKWREYRIVKTIRLNRIDFENFSADLLADRQDVLLDVRSHAVHGHAAFLRKEQAVDVLAERTLAAAVVPDDRDKGTLLNLEIDLKKRGAFGVFILIGYVVKNDHG